MDREVSLLFFLCGNPHIDITDVWENVRMLGHEGIAMLFPGCDDTVADEFCKFGAC